MRRPRIRASVALAAIALLALGGSVFLALFGIDALEGRSDFEFFADSPTYHQAARGGLDGVESFGDLVGIAGNFLGPLLVLRLVGDSYYAVIVVNAALLAFSVVSLARSLRLDAPKFLLVLLLDPITVSSMLSVNKEILALTFIALLVRFYAAGSLGALALAVLVSVLVRWQLTLLLVVTLTLLSRLNPIRERRHLTVFALLLALSILYLAFSETLAPLRSILEDTAADYEGSGAFEKLVILQDSGWYWAIFPFKAAHLLFAMGLRFDRLLAPVNWYNDFWQLLHSTALLVLFAALVRARRLSLHNDVVYISLIYIAVFALTPIYAPRYFYPVYVLWAAALCAPVDRPVLLRRSPRTPQTRRPRVVDRNTGRLAPP